MDNGQVESALALEANLSHKEKLTQVEKINNQFGHASVINMKKLVRNACLIDSEISHLLKEVVHYCATCIKFKKPSSFPIVALSKADDFNETLSVDLHELKRGPKLWYMHMMDEFTRCI